MRQKKIRKLIIFILLYLASNYFIKFKNPLTIFVPLIFGFILYEIIELYQYYNWRRRQALKSIFIFLTISLIVLLIPIIIHFVYFDDNIINKDNLFNFYGDYITFIGTFALGYIVYQRDKTIRMQKKINKAKLLHSTLDVAIHQMNALNNDHKIIERIDYEPKWKEYFYELSALKLLNEREVELELEHIFKHIETLNYYLALEDIKEAKTIHKKFIKNQQYSSTKFNYIEVKSYLYIISYLWNPSVEPMVPWNEKKEVKLDIKRLGTEFTPVIELWIYNYMLKNNYKSLKIQKITFELVDWLMKNEKIQLLVKTQYDKRIITAIVHDAAIKIKRNSEKLNYVWNEFTFKK